MCVRRGWEFLQQQIVDVAYFDQIATPFCQYHKEETSIEGISSATQHIVDLLTKNR
jgi:hypothetical protein